MTTVRNRTIVVAGASGLIGSALVASLRADGATVKRLVRREPRTADEIGWDPAARRFDPAALAGVDAIVNLAGANIAGGRWTAARRTLIRESRTAAAGTLLAAMAALPRRPQVYVSASATGFYGSRGDEVLTEASAPGTGFLAGVCRDWESAAEAVMRLGVRETRMRFGVVLSARDGALARMLPVFRLGLGCRLGDGRQWLSWIALADAVAALRHALDDATVGGACNVCAPEPVTNATFASALGGALHRPACLPAPAWALRLALGTMADEALLASTRAVPGRLLAGGFRFRYPQLGAALAAEFSG